MSLTDDQRIELRKLISSESASALVASRARMVLWDDEGYSVAAIAKLAGVPRPTAYKWLDRYEEFGIAGLESIHIQGCLTWSRRRCVPGSWRSLVPPLQNIRGVALVITRTVQALEAL